MSDKTTTQQAAPAQQSTIVQPVAQSPVTPIRSIVPTQSPQMVMKGVFDASEVKKK
jgi:hypothetical protein